MDKKNKIGGDHENGRIGGEKLEKATDRKG